MDGNRLESWELNWDEIVVEVALAYKWELNYPRSLPLGALNDLYEWAVFDKVRTLTTVPMVMPM